MEENKKTHIILCKNDLVLSNINQEYMMVMVHPLRTEEINRLDILKKISKDLGCEILDLPGHNIIKICRMLFYLNIHADKMNIISNHNPLIIGICANGLSGLSDVKSGLKSIIRKAKLDNYLGNDQEDMSDMSDIWDKLLGKT